MAQFSPVPAGNSSVQIAAITQRLLLYVYSVWKFFKGFPIHSTLCFLMFNVIKSPSM